MLLSSSFMLVEECGDRDEVDKDEDSIGPPISISSLVTVFECEFMFDDLYMFDGDGRFLRGIVDATCLMSIVIAVSKNYNPCHNNQCNNLSHGFNRAVIIGLLSDKIYQLVLSSILI